MSKDSVTTTKCWCLACDPQQGEIGLECTKSQTTSEKEKLVGRVAELMMTHGFSPVFAKDQHGSIVYYIQEKDIFFRWSLTGTDQVWIYTTGGHEVLITGIEIVEPMRKAYIAKTDLEKRQDENSNIQFLLEKAV